MCVGGDTTLLSCALEKRGWESVLVNSQAEKAANEGAIHPSVKQEARCRDCQVGDLRKAAKS